MYKVFVNEKPICLVKPNYRTPLNDGVLISSLPNKTELLELVEDLTKVDKLTEIYIISPTEDLESSFKSITDCFTVIYGAGGLVKNSNGEYLFIKRHGKWDLPKGKIEKNEGIETAAVREVVEECGINDPEIIKTLETTYHVYYHNSQYYLKITYWFLMNYKGNEALIPQQSEGITEVKWMDKKLILSSVYNNTYQNIKMVVESELA